MLTAETLISGHKWKRISREYDCEVPKGDCFRIVVECEETGKQFEFYEETRYPSWSEQVYDQGINSLGFKELK